MRLLSFVGGVVLLCYATDSTIHHGAQPFDAFTGLVGVALVGYGVKERS